MKHIWGVNFVIALAVMFAFIGTTPHAPYPLSPTAKDTSVSFENERSPAKVLLPHFVDNTLSAGLLFNHLQGDEHLTGLNETLGSGACALDYDADGWMDLFVVNGSGQTRYYGRQYWWQQAKGHVLYKNLGDGRFKDVTDESGLGTPSWGMGCVSGDIDNNGYADLLITNIGQNLLYKNNGGGSFTNATQSSGISGEAWSTSAAMADYDNDGLLDIYITNYINFRKGDKTYEANSQFEDSTPVTFNAALYDAQPNKLYRNVGNFRFEDVTHESGTADSDGRGLDVVWLNLDNNRFPDLYISNDSGGGSNSLLYNLGNGRFKQGGIESNVNTAQGFQAITAGDVNNDGSFDLVVAGNNKQPHMLLLNTLNRDSGGKNNTHFSDNARTLGLTENEFAGYSGWGTGLHDLNNDGWLDLFTANGLLTPDPDVDKISQGQRKQLWLNQGGGVFKDASLKTGIPLQDKESARGSVFADFDNDGDIDIYVAHNNGIGQLLTNNTPTDNNWIGIKLLGAHSNHTVTGATIRVTGKTTNQFKQFTRGNSFLSSNDSRLHFGLGPDENVSIEINWPAGDITRLDNVPVNQYVSVKQSENTATPYAYTAKQNNIKQPRKLKIGMDNAKNRADFLSWVVAANGITHSVAELELALNDSSTEVQLAAVELISQHRFEEGFRLLIEALQKTEPQVRLAAIKGLQNYELEASIRWILRMFNDVAPSVRAATAQSFGFFFREEEAIVHRKYLALPHLIRLLDDTHIEVSSAAASALGDAEHFRAVAPLAAKLKNADTALRAEAARALGLIREQSALPLLLTAVQSDTSAVVKAHCLIALKRLGYKEIPHILNELLNPNNSSLAGIETLQTLLDDTHDGVAFDRTLLLKTFKYWFSRTSDTPLTESTEVIKVIERFLRLGFVSQLQPLTDSLRQSDSPRVRKNVLIALIAYDSSRRISHVTEGLNDTSLDVRRAILKSAVQHKVSLPVALLKPLISPLDNTYLDIIAALGFSNSPDAVNELVAIAIDSKRSDNVRAFAITTLAKQPGNIPTLDKSLHKHKSALIREAMIHHWHKKNAKTIKGKSTPNTIAAALTDHSQQVRQTAVEILLKRRDQWARMTLESQLYQPDEDSALREHLIGSLVESDVPYAPAMLIKLANNKFDKMRHEAIKQLVNINTPQVNTYMRQLLTNRGETDQVRLLAAKSLASFNAQQVIEALSH